MKAGSGARGGGWNLEGCSGRSGAGKRDWSNDERPRCGFEGSCWGLLGEVGETICFGALVFEIGEKSMVHDVVRLS